MTKLVRFYGHSDDCFEIEGAFNDEIGCYDKMAVVLLKSAVAEERLAIVGLYSPHGAGTWTAAPALIEEDDDMPAWPIRFTRKHPYSLMLEIEVPDDTTMTVVKE